MHIFSVLFTAETVEKDFSTDEGLKAAADWCRASGITKVYVESFRKIFIEQDRLEKARDYFENEGFEVDGCVTTVGLAKNSNNWEQVGCYSHMPNWDLMEKIFRRTAAVFQTIMVDDFLFTDCDCDDCKKAAAGRSIGEFHSDAMHEMSVERILKPSREVNPACKIIIKYPNWFDRFYSRGYDVVRQTEVFDYTWVGNETREPDNTRWGRYAQTQAFFLQTWVHKINDEKCMGGWYDSIDVKPETYLEQARNTILGGARESMLFCYHRLINDDLGKEDTIAFRSEQEGLHKLAYLISGKKIQGVSTPKKMNEDTLVEPLMVGFIGMMGIPAVGDITLDQNAPAAVLGVQAAKFPDVRSFAMDFHKQGKPLVFTKGFIDMTGLSLLGAPVLDSKGDNWNLMEIPNLEEVRNYLMAPLGVKLTAPSRVALNLYDDDMEVIQNFNNQEVKVSLDLFGRNRKARSLKLVLSQDRKLNLSRSATLYSFTIPPRTLALLY